MKVSIERPFPRSEEIKAYYEAGEGSNNSLDRVFGELKSWFNIRTTKIGKGGHHVWVHDSEDNRILIISE
jgi:hypothetical protein